MPVELAPGQIEELNVQMVPIAGPGEVMLDRFYVLNRCFLAANEAQFEIWCWIKNVGQTAATHHLNMQGQIYVNQGQLVHNVDLHQDFTVEAGDVYKYFWVYHSFPFDPAWMRVYIDDEPIMPRFDWIIGYINRDVVVECKAPHVGTDWAALVYTQRSDVDRWTVHVYTPPPPPYDFEHELRYPELRSDKIWTSLDHLVIPLLSQRTYEGYIRGGNREGWVRFTTK